MISAETASNFSAAPSRLEGTRAEPKDMVIAVQLLGAFRVSTENGAVPEGLWRGARAKALFKFLAYRAGTAISRDALMDVLWPELDPETSQNSLHKAVHVLRQTINIALGWDGKELLEFGGGCYALRADGLRVDALQFKRSIFEAKWCERLGDGEHMRHHYECAVDLYRGDLLEDDYLVEWAIPERERLRNDYGLALRKLASWWHEAGRLDLSSTYYHKLLAADPCAEDAYRALMEIAVDAGRRGDVLRLYRQYKDALQRELHLPPSADIEALLARIS